MVIVEYYNAKAEIIKLKERISVLENKISGEEEITIKEITREKALTTHSIYRILLTQPITPGN